MAAMVAILDLGTVLAIFYLQITRCFLLSFKSFGLFIQEAKNRNIQNGRNSGNVAAIFDFESVWF